MKAIVGLGNPGPEYLFTRHNFGFMLIDFLMQKINGKNRFIYERDIKGEWARISIVDKDIFLLKPLTFMNLSGISVKAFCERFNLSSKDILIAYDDIDLPLGKLRFRKKVSSGGHKGMGSVIAYLQTEEIARLRLGIGPKPPTFDMVNYVLGEFTKDELLVVKEVLLRAYEGISTLIDSGIDMAMSKFNG